MVFRSIRVDQRPPQAPVDQPSDHLPKGEANEEQQPCCKQMGGHDMAFYLYQLAYSKEAIQSLVASPSDREAAARKLIEALGGKLHHMFFAFGDWDVICLIEGPDDKMMMAGAAAVASAGTVSKSSTVKLMTAADAMAAMTMAGKVTGAYKPPMG
jgi:uncharacterized protein with GYD domain